MSRRNTPSKSELGKSFAKKSTNFVASMKKLLEVLRGHRLSLVLIFVLATVSTLLNVAGPMVMAKATNEMVRGFLAVARGNGRPIDFTLIASILLVMFTLYISSWVIGIIEKSLTAKVATKVSYDIRNRLIEKIHNLPLGYFNEQKKGDVLSRAARDCVRCMK